MFDDDSNRICDEIHRVSDDSHRNQDEYQDNQRSSRRHWNSQPLEISKSF
jgi:hypothetical protein